MTHSRSRQRSIVAWFAILSGATIMLAAFDAGPMADANKHAPAWIIFLCGLLFTACGSVVLVTNRAIARFLAGVCVVSVTTVCAWISIFGDARYFSSSIPFLADELGVLLARALFGGIAVMGLAICLRVLKVSRPSKNR